MLAASIVYRVSSSVIKSQSVKSCNEGFMQMPGSRISSFMSLIIWSEIDADIIAFQLDEGTTITVFQLLWSISLQIYLNI